MNMSIKEEVLKLLEKNKGKVLSGEEIASSLNVSRASIWKAIKNLQKNGYKISASTKKGYCLNIDNDIISEAGIRINIEEKYQDIKLIYKDKTTSTNDDLMALAAKGVKDTTIEIALTQTNGRGRIGRQFVSPIGGIYISFLINFKNTPIENITIVTPKAAVAVSRAIEKLTLKKVGIKWVNDIYLNNKKICGILTQAATDVETNTISTIVIGLGVNFDTPINYFPKELQNIVTSLFVNETPSITKNELIGAIINELLNEIEDLSNKTFLEEYKSKSIVLQKDIKYYFNNEEKEGKAIDILDNGALVILDKDNRKTIINSGEVSIKL